MGLQLFVTAFVIFAASRIYMQWRRETISLGAFLFWLIIWIGLITVVYWPGTIVFIAETVGIGRGIDVLVYGGIVLLFYLVYRLYIKQEETSQEITKIIREIALKDLKD